MDNCGNELNLLLHAFGEFAGLLVFPFGQFQSREPTIRALVSFFRMDVLQGSKKFNLIPYLHLFVESPLFRQVTNPILQLRSNLPSKDFYPAGIGSSDIHDHPDGRSFTSPVWTKQSIDSAGVNSEAEVAHRCKLPESLSNVGNRNGRGSGGHVWGFPFRPLVTFARSGQ